MNEADGERTRALLEEMGRRPWSTCAACGRALCGHDWVASLALGFRPSPRCRRCLAREFGREDGEFHQGVRSWVDSRACYRAAWAWADRDEGGCHAGSAA